MYQIKWFAWPITQCSKTQLQRWINSLLLRMCLCGPSIAVVYRPQMYNSFLLSQYDMLQNRLNLLPANLLDICMDNLM